MNRLVLVMALMGAVIVASGVVVYRSARSAGVTAPAPTPPVGERSAELAENAGATTPATLPATAGTARPAPKRAAPPKAAPSPTAAPVEITPTAGTLLIVSDVPGAQVFLDREFIGATPVIAKDVTPGSHQLNVSVQGYDAQAQIIDVSPGSREIAITFRQVRLDAAIDVVHKHRMGSCRGRLVATPRGLRYETTDKDDVFGVGLLELETFHIDYLTKNLRIQPRKGKRYDFTDPDGNADRLFVFHRDVDRARERLKKGDVPAGQ